MNFFAHHGCFAEEQSIGTHFVVDVSIEADILQAAKSDDIEQTVNYMSVYQQIKLEMAVSSHLIENVAYRIAKKILTQFLQAQNVTVKVAKLNPPLGGQVQQSSATVVLHRRKIKLFWFGWFFR
ncbi:7,8-dihydroneopterin aldolase [Bacteroidia bacterium]|nr:7,8-dihydroneopterin aldolase [Bacteroidia bacterium]